MELSAVAFPALVVADDGWVQYLSTGSEWNEWSSLAIRKYAKRSVLLYDSSNRAWLIESIAPKLRRNALVRAIDRLRNPRIPVEILVRPAAEAPLSAVQTALLAAIDADDDILTQHVEASHLKASVRQAASFEAIVRVLRAAEAI